MDKKVSRVCGAVFSALWLTAACQSGATVVPDAAPPAQPVAAARAESAPAVDVLAGAWPVADQRAVLDKSLTISLAPQLDSLTPGEKACVAKLLEVGTIMQHLYERSLHHQADQVRTALARPDVSQDLRDLFRIFNGPIGTNAANERAPFVSVDPEVAGKNVYPWGVAKDEVEAFLSLNPDRRGELLHLRSVVRRAASDAPAQDLAALDRHPVLDTLHPGLRQRIQGAAATGVGFYGAPYSVVYADDLVRAHGLLLEGADAVADDDIEFARFLRSRARDLLVDDYEAGDASWVTGKFQHLNAQIGSYEVYSDQLYGVKAFHSLSLLIRDEAATRELKSAITDLQAFEDSLPYKHHKPVKSDIAVGVYNVVADFGQSRGRNTATILPNEAHITRKYGRTILLRANIMRNPALFEMAMGRWQASVESKFAEHLTVDGGFYRTLWHEIGHYLGVDSTEDGRTLDIALETNASTFEEMKADLVSLYVVKALRRNGYHDQARAQSIYAGGIRRTLQSAQPRPTQPYQTMQLMQMNYFLENGLLKFDETSGKLTINYRRYHKVVTDLLREVLAIQRAGDKARSDEFIKRYTAWDEKLHGVIAANMKAQQKYRYTIMRYAATE